MTRPDLTVVPDLEVELDRLYELRLGEFTAARNELAKRLKKSGQKAEGERVASLTKPSASAWAVNQLSRREPDRVRELLEAGSELVDAQRAALAGEGADRFDEAGRRQREAVRQLARLAAGVLAEAGHRPSDVLRERIASSLRAASVSPEGREALERGRLESDFESEGLGLLAGMAPAAPVRARRTAPAREEARIREAREQLEAARAEERRLAEAAGEAAREAEEARAAADRANERAERLADDAAEAAQAVTDAVNALERLQSG